MHLDESKKFDKRNIERNLKDGIITLKEYENFLAKLPDVSEKVYSTDEDEQNSNEFIGENDSIIKKKKVKPKAGRGR